MQGFDIDFCRALAAVVLGDTSKVEFLTMSSKNRLTALVSDEIDVLSRTTTFTATRDMRNAWIPPHRGSMTARAFL